MAQYTRDERHAKVAMRMIGHEILLSSCDSLSRVLPIEKEADRYKIQFESEFQFKPEELAAIVDGVIAKTGIAASYIVEVEKCATCEVVHSYEVGVLNNAGGLPCGTRAQPRDCYRLLITILDAGQPVASLHAANPGLGASAFYDEKQANYFMIALLNISLLIMIGLFIYIWKKKQQPEVNPNLIAIGEYQFDKMHSALLIENQRVELTSKESDLLLLLYNAANTTLGREVILKNVWGDEGDYVGRTLDVFISKLRKKLEVDSSIKIVNIRGIGYKLVMNAPS